MIRLGSENLQRCAEPGKVYLVGAGPGNPDLLTVRAKALIESADLIAVDELVSESLLEALDPRGEVLRVGYRGVHSAGQAPEAVHPKILEASAQGKSVVRLKSGDPVVLGRVSEEVRILNFHQVPFEVVPGITAASGASAFAGIPLTFKGGAHRYEILSAHHAEPIPISKQEMQGKTLVLYMVRRHIKSYIQSMIKGGNSPDLAAAFVLSATLPEQEVITGTLANISELVEKVTDDRPGLLMVGEAVRLRRELNWFNDQKPLRGKRIVLGRARPEPSDLALQLRALGANVHEVGRVRATVETASLKTFIQNKTWDRFDGVMFACKSSVTLLAHELLAQGLDFRVFGNKKILAVGEDTLSQFHQVYVTPDVSARGHCHEALGEIKDVLKGRNWLVLTSDRGRPDLLTSIRDMGCEISSYPIYRLTAEDANVERLSSRRFDLAMVPSSSAGEAVSKAIKVSLSPEIPVITMGPKTTRTMQDLGHFCIEAAHDNKKSLLLLAQDILLEGRSQ